MNRKGLFFSLDALIALGVGMIFFSMLFYWVGYLDMGVFQEYELLVYTQSVASVMEEQGVFAENNVISFLGNYTRNETCFNVSVYSQTNTLQYSVLKTGCSGTSYPIYVTRSFVLENTSLYIAVIEGWYE